MSLRPHGRRLIRPAAVLVVSLGVGGFAAGRLPEGRYLAEGRLGVALVVLAVVVRWVLVPYLRWLSHRVLVTDRRILVRTGVLTRSGRDVPLAWVTDLAQVRTPVQRLFGCGTLLVDTVGERSGLVLHDVPRIESVICELDDLLDRTELDAVVEDGGAEESSG